MIDPIAIDFETEAINGPWPPPRPVGVAIQWSKDEAEYLAWGHPERNNADLHTARSRLAKAWNSGRPLLFHNAIFDIGVAMAHFLLPFPDQFFDTRIELFLFDPHTRTLHLKEAAEIYLHEPPEERDALRDHLVERGVIHKNVKNWGAFICEGFGDVVGRYSIGDVRRTWGLHNAFYPTFDSRMLEAYARERRLMPILQANSCEGIALDVPALEKATAFYEAAFKDAERWLWKRLGREFNIDADADLAAALRASGVVQEFKKTKTGRDSVAKDALPVERFTDREVFSVLGWRQRLATCLSTFMRPWLSSAKDGRILTEWNQVRGEQGGARTGRMSCHPNFQNIPKDWTDKGDGFVQPEGFPTLPHLRDFLLPDPGCVWLHRDYNQQELRILAHFEDAALADAYRQNPRLDMHDFVQGVLRNAGVELERRAVKTLNFGMLYGMGLAKLAAKLKLSVDEAREIRRAHRAALPGLAGLEAGLRARARAGKPIRTWGGRSYMCEPPAKRPDGGIQTFEYKLLNYLIQGSAADCTKQALINYEAARKEGRLVVTVHDEINVSVPVGAVAEEDARLREAMESVPFDVPMLSDAKTGPNWGSLEAALAEAA